MKGLVVITGASSGIGAALAKKFNANGFPLLLIARRVDKLQALKLDNCICAKVDVTDRNQLEKAIKSAENKFGNVNCLINNAGVMLLNNVHKQDRDEFKTMLDVNVLALMDGCGIVLPKMKSEKTGTIINISSVAGRKTYSNHAAYCGTKFAVHGFSETLREEVSPDNVRVMVVSPGAVETELLSHTTDGDIRKGYSDWKDDIGGVIDADVIAENIFFAYNQPQHVCVREIVIASTRQEP